MGINGFLAFLKKKYPHVIRKEHISLFSYTRVFIDISGYIYKYMSTFGKQDYKWVNAILSTLYTFKSNSVIPIPIFDGKPPVSKEHEIKDRKEKRQQHSLRIEKLQDSINNYQEGTYTDEHIQNLQEEMVKLEKRGQFHSRLLKPSSSPFTTEDMVQLKEHLNILQRQFISITEEDITLLKTIFKDLGITYVQAPGESEGLCCSLVRNGEGFAVASGDSDCIMHRANVVILQVDYNGMCTYIENSEILETLHLTAEQLVDYGILMGCDYNLHCKNNKLGPVNALKLIQEYKSIENIPDHLLHKDTLLTELCREMFTVKIEDDIKLIHDVATNEDVIEKYKNMEGISYMVLKQLIELQSKILIYKSNNHKKHHIIYED